MTVQNMQRWAVSTADRQKGLVLCSVCALDTEVAWNSVRRGQACFIGDVMADADMDGESLLATSRERMRRLGAGTESIWRYYTG